MHFLLLFLLFLSACTPSPSKKKLIKGEYLFRKNGTFFFNPPPAKLREKKIYAWEEKYQGKYPRITKEFFRCKGNPLNPVIIQKKEGKEPVYHRDCSGSDHHGLPLRDGKEFIYPCLITLLNYVQEKTEKRVVITTGHRCREHNSYCDSTPANFGSKHMMGAEVDFYVEGVSCEKVIALLQHYYSEKKDFEKFERYEKETNVSTKPWYNKEIFIKYFKANEGRDFDNQHPHPYISLQVRYDRDLDKKISFDEAAIKNYLRN